MVTPDPLPFLASAGMFAAAAPTPVAGGWDNHIWKFATADGAAHALRVFRSRADMDALRAAAIREATCLRIARANGVPAPGIEFEGTLDGVPFHVQSWMPGEPLLDVVAKAPWRLGRLGRAFGQVHARVHAVPAAGAPPLSAARWAALRPAVLRDALVREDAASHFCHFDFHPRNVLSDGERITAVLDFSNAGLGDPRGDCAMTAALLSLAPVDAGLKAPAFEVVRRLFVRAYRAGYAAEAGAFDAPPLFRAAAAARFLGDMRAATAEGRAAAGAKDLRRVKRDLLRQLRAAGLR